MGDCCPETLAAHPWNEVELTNAPNPDDFDGVVDLEQLNWSHNAALRHSSCEELGDDPGWVSYRSPN